MAKATALLVGLKQVDPGAYRGWDGRNGCWGCELDVDNIERILSPLTFQANVLKTPLATAKNVLRCLDTSALILSKGDIFVFYYSGHGGQQPDESGDELDGRDETLILYDRELIDDELDEIWLKFRPAVRIVMLSDSCNSGTNLRLRGTFDRPSPFVPVKNSRLSKKMKAQMIHLGGCRDGFGSAGYEDGGDFTIALCNAWQAGSFHGSYKDLYKHIATAVTGKQRPQYNEYGPVTNVFRNQRPFTI